MKLENLGWNNNFEKSFSDYRDKGYLRARIIRSERYKYKVIADGKIIDAEISGRYRYNAKRHRDFPTVGDWVAVSKRTNEDSGIIYALLPRENAFVRKMPVSGGRKIRNGKIVGGSPEEQVLAANIDIAFIVMSVDGNFNISRIERYLTLIYNSGVMPVIVLNKIDVTDKLDDYLEQVKEVAVGVLIHAVSAIENINMTVFETYMNSGKTIVFFGSSGVGKSTITNRLLGDDKQKTSIISSSNGKGRHTTSTSQMLFHESGCMVIDTPGLRELQLWCDESALDMNFQDVISLIDTCKYNDCKHDTEVGCAIKNALESGELSQNRYESYLNQYEEIQSVGKMKQQVERFNARRRKYNK